jgi:hypothetical protein
VTHKLSFTNEHSRSLLTLMYPPPLVQRDIRKFLIQPAQIFPRPTSSGHIHWLTAPPAWVDGRRLLGVGAGPGAQQRKVYLCLLDNIEMVVGFPVYF